MYEQFSFLSQSNRPLAERVRPTSLDEFIGQEEAVGKSSVLRREIAHDSLSSMILWGPPGCGKTTVVHIISNITQAELYKLSAISAGVKEIKEILQIGKRNHLSGLKTILFLDEIHRLNKAQQDVLLADVEQGNVVLIGATTENPSFEINKALLSRTRVVVFQALTNQNICTLLKHAIQKDQLLSSLNFQVDDECLSLIATISGGDARNALNCLDSLVQFYRDAKQPFRLTAEDIKPLLTQRAAIYDKSGDEHYNIISALHKSMRNSDPDAAVYWLARMLEAGEDPLFIARRLIRFASEDIGLASNNALQTAVAAYNAVHFIGMPECSVNLAQAVIYLSVLPKSNSIYMAYEKAKKDARNTQELSVPLHLRNASTELMESLGFGMGYQYAHDYAETVTDMKCLPEQLQGQTYYFPKNIGHEQAIKERLDQIKAKCKKK